MLTAEQAREALGIKKKASQGQRTESCDKILIQIEKDITAAILRQRTVLEYKWDYYYGRINDKFPDAIEEFYSYDGGGGIGDTITDLGKEVKNRLKRAGYNVTLYSGNLTIDWSGK